MEEQKQKKIYSFNYVPLLTDFILRWGVLGAWRLHYLGDAWFWIINILVIPTVIFFSNLVYTSKNKLDIYEPNVDVKNTSGSILMSLLMVFFGVYITFNLLGDIHTIWKVLISIGMFLGFGFYVIMVNAGSAKKPSPEKSKEKKNLAPTYQSNMNILSIEQKNEDGTDLNDVEIVRLEGILNYTNDRVNSYILESALFSGLAFAGFITLITSDKLHISEISVLLNSIKRLLNSLINFDMSSLMVGLKVFTQDDLIIIILIESLFCTLAFVSVIASRLHFSDILEEVEISVKTARSYNDKEEEVVLLNLEANQEQYTRRIAYLSKKIEKEVTIATQKLDSIKPILNTIRVIRTLGMIFFFSMIITSALLINTFLALFVLLSSIVVTIIMNVDHTLRIKKMKKFNLQLPKRVNHTN